MDASAEVVLETLRSLDRSKLEPLPNAGKLARQLHDLEQILSKILPALPVAVKQVDSNPIAKQLLQEVDKLANDAEFLLDELESQVSLARERQRNRKLMMVGGCFNPSYFTRLALEKRLANITAEFRGREPVARRFSAEQEPDDREEIRIGRDADLENVVKLLLSDDDDGELGISVVRIFGSPGIGKTTLALAALNHARLQSQFNVRARVVVSETFESPRVTQDLSDLLGIKTPSNNMGLASLLKERLANKKFLFVLDQVREIDPAEWTAFMASLSSAAPGSRVVMTMNTEADTSFLGGTGSSYELKRLTDEDCWSLLESFAFPGKPRTEYLHLESVGMEVARKCEGRPLAAKVLGRILKDKTDESTWKRQLKYGPWESGDEISTWDSLFMRYDGLPARLKRCFAHCYLFPKDYKLLKEMLIQLWIAGNFVRDYRGKTSLETTAENYIRDLESMSFLGNLNEGQGISMPLPVTNLARLVSGNKYYHYSLGSDAPSAPAQETIRHISCIYDVSMKFEELSRYKNLHTLLIACSPPSTRAVYSDQVLPDNLFTHFPELRALSLSGLPIQYLPDSIGNLRQLRLLDLSHTPIDKLPATTTTLSNLLTLKLNNCVYMDVLPSMENSRKLRHLDISGSGRIKAMPQGMGRLTNLCSLSDFVVTHADESRVSELGDLVHLSGKLTISGLQNVTDSSDAREANLGSKTGLRQLVLEWTDKLLEHRNENVESEVLDYLKPCSNLEMLSIICYGGTRFPEWISQSQKLVHVTISYCRKSVRLPLLGKLPRLETLSIEGMDQVMSIANEFCGDVSQGETFPSLEKLEFKNMPWWGEWSFGSVEFGVFPRLKLLKIERCPKLKQFKVPMTALQLLTISECQELTAFSLENYPSLRELDIQYCPNLKEMPPSFPSLTKLRIWGCRELTSLSNAGPTDAVCEEFPCLLELDIQNCTSLKELPQEFPLLEKLRIRSCKQLYKLSKFPKLHDVILEECGELSLGDEVEVSSLASMVISQLPKFIHPRAQLFQCLSRLINLEISHCANLEALTEKEEQALHSLERLVIDGCPKLKQLPDMLSCFSSLRELIVMGCEGLEFFPEMALPPVFKRLVVAKCKHLKSLPPKLFHSREIGLEFLEIFGCPSLVSLSECTLPVSLCLLSVSDCTNLKSLPAGLNRYNSSLTSLRISDCRSLENFPHEGLPSNIRSLSVINCGEFKALWGWGLLKLGSLRNLSIGGCAEMINLEGAMLPESVVSLLLKGFPKLKSLSGLRSLDILTIRDCGRLETLAEDKLPASLSCLYISNCPVLKQRCGSREAQDWSKIGHIPLIDFDFQSIR